MRGKYAGKRSTDALHNNMVFIWSCALVTRAHGPVAGLPLESCWQEVRRGRAARPGEPLGLGREECGLENDVKDLAIL